MKKITSIVCLLLLACISSFAKQRKVVYVVLDGIPAEHVERLHLKNVFDIASHGAYNRAFTGGEVGQYSQTPTISAVGYMNMLTATWVNKHNVPGNGNLKPNYNYWSIYRIAKEQPKNYTTGLFSSWEDNRTVLIGEGKESTNHLKMDYVSDGYEKDKQTYAEQEKHLEIFDIDEKVSFEAAKTIRKNAPDVNWVYLWYTDSAGHIEGNSDYFDKYIKKADEQLGRIWKAVQYREKHFDEEWLIIATTDHGRTENGYHHGGQSIHERTTWISSNQPVNKHFDSKHLALVDINPTICKFMNFELPNDVLREQDGQSFYGGSDIDHLTSTPYNDKIVLHWESYTKRTPTNIYVAVSNHFKEGKKDKWIKLDTVLSGDNEYTVKLKDLPKSKFYKFSVDTSNSHLSRWVKY